MCPQPHTFGDPRTAEGDVVTFHASCTFAGAAPLSASRSKQCAIARTGVGTFTFTLPRAYPRLLSFAGSMIGRAGVPLTPIITSDLTTSTGVIAFKMADPTGAAADPNNAEKAVFEAVVSGMP